MIEREDIQGLALHAYDWQPFACFFLVSFAGGDARAFVSRWVSEVSSASSNERSERLRRNIAFSASGLRALGLGEEWLASFPREFLQGMAHPERSLSLGDTGDSEPSHWEFGGPEQPVDALLAVYAPTEAELERASDAVEALLARCRLSASTEEAYLPRDGRDHLGRPLKTADPQLGRPWWRRRRKPSAAPGEFILGYRNAAGYLAQGPRAPVRSGTRPRPHLTDYGRAVDLGRNGTYLVLRKLEQDVPAFMQSEPSELEPPDVSGMLERSHRLLHRDRLYGERHDPSTPESAELERGVLALTLSANLRSRFESVHAARSRSPLEAFERVRGGVYLFMPGLTALGYLTEL